MRTYHTVADKDWVKFYALAGQVYTVTTSQLSPDVDTVLQLYDRDGVTLLDENDDYAAGSKASRIVWTAPADGWYYARITHFDRTYEPRYSSVCGNHYQIAVETTACAAAADAYEPDNLYTQAAVIPADGTAQTRTFHTVADKDWIKFYVLARQVYTITTSQLSPDVDTVLQLYDRDGVTLLDENDDYVGGSEGSRIVWTAPADGWYYARVTHFDRTYEPHRSPFCGNQYQVVVETSACVTPPDAYEPDNFYTQAAVIPTDGAAQTRTFHTVADKDWLTFHAWGGQLYTVTTSRLSPDVDTVLQLYDADGVTLLDENDDYLPGSRASNLTWVAPADGWYFVRITQFDSSYDPRLSQMCGNQYSVAVREQIMDVVKTAQPARPDLRVGDEIWYTIVVTNLMNTSQTNVVITDTIPEYTSYVVGSARVSQGSVSGPDPLVAAIGDLSPGQAATLRFRVTVNRDGQGRTITNQAIVASDQQVQQVQTPLTTVTIRYYYYVPIVLREHPQR
jgi:uncharacterized repeat protein (TIGR01451 family)